LSFLLDTDICSAYIKGNKRVFQKFLQYGGRLHISTITLGEMFTWAMRKHGGQRRLKDLQDLQTLVSVLDITTQIANRFGEIRAALMDAGLPTPDLDILNGATALVHSMRLVTHNTKDYANISGLGLEDWLGFPNGSSCVEPTPASIDRLVTSTS
jgi:tRNA(fMet)-specific endonuclease VapC